MCHMKWYRESPRPNWSLTILHISVVCGVKSIVEFIVSYIEDPNPSKENGITPIYSASQHVHSNIFGIQSG